MVLLSNVFIKLVSGSFTSGCPIISSLFLTFRSSFFCVVIHCILSLFYRFIGELFKLKMLTENIMHDCVFKLLRTKDPENLECLCRLLTTIGKELDTDKAKVLLAFFIFSSAVSKKK